MRAGRIHIEPGQLQGLFRKIRAQVLRDQLHRHARSGNSVTLPRRRHRQAIKSIQLLPDICFQGLCAHLYRNAFRRVTLTRECDVDLRFGETVCIAFQIRSDGSSKMHFDRRRRFLIEHEACLQIERLARREPSGFEAEIAHDAARLRPAILERDGRVGDRQPCDRGQLHRLAVCGRRLLRRVALAEVRPILASTLVSDEAYTRAVEPDRADFDLAAQKREQANADARLLNRSERLIAEPRRIPETRGTGFERDPGKYRELEIAAQREFASGLLFHQTLDVVPIVVRIDEQHDQQQSDADQCDEAAHHPGCNLDSSHREFLSGQSGPTRAAHASSKF